jgi:hypothetical protein
MTVKISESTVAEEGSRLGIEEYFSGYEGYSTLKNMLIEVENVLETLN